MDGLYAWMDAALCTQVVGDFFHPDGQGASVREAKLICRSCTVKSDCLAYALAHDERFGVWGGLSERERRRLRRPMGVT